MDKELLEQLEGWEYKQLNGIDVLISYDNESDGKIGIELIRNRKTGELDHVNGFVMDSGDRVYDPNRFTNIQRTAIAVVEGYYYGKQVQDIAESWNEVDEQEITNKDIPTKDMIPIPENKKQEPGEEKDIAPDEQNRVFFPEILTKQQLTVAHPGAIPILVNLQQTDPIYIKERKGRGGMVKYVEGSYIIRALNLAFLFDWSFHILDVREDDNEITVLGKLVVQVDGKTITKTQYGIHAIQNRKGTSEPLSIGNDMKGAATDSLKKCASQLGIAQDVYTS